MYQLFVSNVTNSVPILPGYGRILLALISFYYMPTDYVMAGSCYVLSAFLDAFDGHAARAFNQGETSKDIQRKFLV